MTTKDVITKLQLQPHPEGGYYRETYRCSHQLVNNSGNERNVSTAIYFLLENQDISRFHRIRSDELWFFHQGQALEIISIENNELKITLLGNDIANGESPQAVIPANCWFGSRLKDANGYALVSCTVAPGFDFSDFELAKKVDLLSEYPKFKDIIEDFT